MHRRQEKSTLHFLQFLRLHSTALQFCNFIGFSTLFFLETAPGVGDNAYSLTTALTSTAYDRTHRVTATPGFLFFNQDRTLLPSEELSRMFTSLCLVNRRSWGSFNLISTGLKNQCLLEFIIVHT